MKKNKLKNHELDRLSEILGSLSPSAMNLEMLDGFFAALICSPNLILPNEYIPIIFGGDEDAAFDSQEEAMEFFNLTMRHWNFIADELQRSLTKKNHVHYPIILEDENGIELGNDWATGFMRGVSYCYDDWQEFLNNEDYGGSIIPMLMLFHEHDEDKETRTNPISVEQRKNIIIHMIAGLAHIYRYFAPHRVKAPEVIKSSHKVGRNDPCYCGSHRKYKHCCGANQPTIH